MKILQLRATVFLPQNIGYTNEVATKFNSMLNLNGQIQAIPLPGVPMNALGQNTPQWGMPWSIIKQKGNESIYNVNFLPGKVDIILNKESDYKSGDEENFLRQSADWFQKICDSINAFSYRLAYAPLYVLSEIEEGEIDKKWNNIVFLKKIEGSEARDINLTYNYKREIDIDGKKVQLNLLHNIFDGTKSVRLEKTTQDSRVIMVQLDLNSIPTCNYSFSGTELLTFFKSIQEVREQCINELSL